MSDLRLRVRLRVRQCFINYVNCDKLLNEFKIGGVEWSFSFGDFNFAIFFPLF